MEAFPQPRHHCISGPSNSTWTRLLSSSNATSSIASVFASTEHFLHLASYYAISELALPDFKQTRVWHVVSACTSQHFFSLHNKTPQNLQVA